MLVNAWGLMVSCRVSAPALELLVLSEGRMPSLVVASSLVVGLLESLLLVVVALSVFSFCYRPDPCR